MEAAVNSSSGGTWGFGGHWGHVDRILIPTVFLVAGFAKIWDGGSGGIAFGILECSCAVFYAMGSRGSWGWQLRLLAGLVCTTFLGYHLAGWIHQRGSCGCFGSLDVPPVAMVGLTTAMAVACFVSIGSRVRAQSIRWLGLGTAAVSLLLVSGWTAREMTTAYAQHQQLSACITHKLRSGRGLILRSGCSACSEFVALRQDELTASFDYCVIVGDTAPQNQAMVRRLFPKSYVDLIPEGMSTVYCVDGGAVPTPSLVTVGNAERFIIHKLSPDASPTM